MHHKKGDATLLRASSASQQGNIILWRASCKQMKKPSAFPGMESHDALLHIIGKPPIHQGIEVDDAPGIAEQRES